MAVVGSAEVVITADVGKFDKQLKDEVTKAAAGIQVPVSVVPQVSSSEKSLRSFGLLQAQALKDNEAFNEAQKKSASFAGKFGKAIESADTKLAQFGLTSRDVSILLGAGLAGGVAFAARSIVGFGVDSVNAAANLGEALNLARVTFGSFSKDVEQFSKSAADGLGLSQRAALDSVGAFGALGKAAGLNQEASAKFGVSLTQVAADLASFKNIEGGTAAASQLLASGLVGQTEVLRQLGIIIDQDTLKRAAQRDGIIKGNEELTQQQKILATYSEILRQTKDAQGDFARTSDSLPNQLRKVSAQVENLKAGFGQALLPATSDAAGALDQFLGTANKVIGPLGQVREKLGDLTAGFLKINPVFATGPFGLIGRALSKLIPDIGKTADAENNLISVTDLLAISQGGLGASSEQAAAALSLVGAAADAASKLFAEAAAGFDKRLTGFTPKFGEDFREEATKAGGAAKKAGDAAERLRRANEDADQSITDSKRKLARDVRKADEDIIDAQKKVADVERTTSREIRADQERLLDASRDLARQEHEAQRQRIDDARDAQQAVSDAQKDFVQAQADLNAETQNLTPEEKRARQLAELRKKAVESEQEGFRRLAAVHASATEDKLNEADKVRDIARLERDLAEDRIDSARDVADAKLEQTRTIRDANERVEDSERDLAKTELQAARSIADAQKSIGEAASGAAKKAALSVKSLLKSFRSNASDLEGFDNSLTSIGKRLHRFAVETDAIADTEIKEAFLAHLQELGPEAAPFLQELADVSDKELEGVVEAFDRQIKAAKQAADDNFDLFPANFAEKIEAARQAAENKLGDLVSNFREASKQGGAALDAVGQDALTMALTLDQAVKNGKISLDKQEQYFLDLALSATTPQARIDALKQLLASLQSKNIQVTADTDPAIDSLIEFLRTISTGPFSELFLPGFGQLEELAIQQLLAIKGRRAGGGSVSGGDAFLVGERGPELFIPNRNGQVISNDELLAVLRKIADNDQKTTQAPVEQTFIIQGKTDERVLANELAFRMGRDSQR